MTRLALLLVSVLAACQSEAPKPPSDVHGSLFAVTAEQQARLKTVTVAHTPIDDPLTVPGVVAFNELGTSDVVPLVSGVVQKILVREGDKVTQGQLLMTIASPDNEEALASLRGDQADLANKKAVLARDQDLYQHQGLSLEELQTAEAASTSAEAAVASDLARARITGTGENVAELRSPISGTVVARTIAVGDVVSGGSTPCFTVTDPTAVWVVGHLYVRDLKRAANGDLVDIASPLLDAPRQGTITYIGASLDPETLTIPVRITVDNPGGLLKAGLYVDAAIHPSKPQSAIVLPVSAVLRDSDNLPFVYQQAAPGQYARVHVTLGDQVGDTYLIDDGLKDGEVVLTDGAVFVQFADSLEH